MLRTLNLAILAIKVIIAKISTRNYYELMLVSVEKKNAKINRC